MRILGISAYYHDSAAALIEDGVIVAAAQEERFTRIKNDASFPRNAIASCLAAGGSDATKLDAVAYYDKPLDTFARVVRSFQAAGPRSVLAWRDAMREWGRRKLWIPYEIERELRRLSVAMPGRIVFAEHHMSHAAAAFYPSPFESACVLTFDGVGEWATSSIGVGRGHRLELLEEQRFPDSIGLLYSAFTAATGFRVNSGEYKLMGLAPYGEPTYRDLILDKVVSLAADGSFTLDRKYFAFLAGRSMTSTAFERLFGPNRNAAAPITRRDCDLARSIQAVIEEIVVRMARHGREITGESNAVLAGGVALNCVANSRVRAKGIFDDIWVQPAAGDAGSAVGCALWALHEVNDVKRTPALGDGMRGALLGPAFDPDEIAADLTEADRPFERIPDPHERAQRIAGELAGGAVIGLFSGHMEFGPRALGARSILADPRGADTQRRLNAAVKRREAFRPFAPAVLAERAEGWFDPHGESAYMTFVADVVGFEPDGAGAPVGPEPSDELDLTELSPGGPIPAVTHVDGSARLQTVDAERSPELHRILAAFDALTGCPVLVNTSFNVRGEPIVCTPTDAYRCFMTTELDWLIVEDCLLRKDDQPEWEGDADTSFADD